MLYKKLITPMNEFQKLIDSQIQSREKKTAEIEKNYIGQKKADALQVIEESYTTTTGHVRDLTADYVHRLIADWKMYFYVSVLDYSPEKVKALRDMLSFPALTEIEKSTVQRMILNSYWLVRLYREFEKQEQAENAPADHSSPEYAAFVRNGQNAFRIDSYIEALDKLQGFLDGIIQNYVGRVSPNTTTPEAVNAGIAIGRMESVLKETESKLNSIEPMFFMVSNFDSIYVSDSEQEWLDEYEKVLKSGYFEKVLPTRADAESIILRSRYRESFLNWYKETRIAELVKDRVEGKGIPIWYHGDGLFYYSLTAEDMNKMETRGVLYPV